MAPGSPKVIEAKAADEDEEIERNKNAFIQKLKGKNSKSK